MSIDVSFTRLPAVSAIYYALLQCGYNYYALEKSASLCNKLETYANGKEAIEFFNGAKQKTCDVYPYWPRAYMLEVASFFIDNKQHSFSDFNAYRNIIKSAGNISDAEKGHDFWEWIRRFPSELNGVFEREAFREYFAWEEEYLDQQETVLESDIGEDSGYRQSM